jgi:hypothetical protein
MTLALFLTQPLLARAAAEGERGAGPAPPRLRFIDGDVSFWRPGAEDWAPATVNTPLAAGDSLYTGDDGNLELQAGPSAFVRAGAGTDLSLTALETDLQQFKLTTGHVAVDARRLPRGQAIEVDTPNGALTIDHPGYYRVDVEDDRTAYTARRGGAATLVPANGDATDLEADKQVVVKGTDTPEVAANDAPEQDDWDRWNLGRGEHASQPSRSASYVPPDVAGSDDLDESGDWRDTPRYGHVWVPHGVAADWAPYSTGRWVWDPYYGWTWVDDAPWGWAPYHYGRWVYVDGFWGWAPGPVIVRPVYSPALVAFFGGPHVTVAVGTPFPFVSWVALGWGEPLIPWWGPVGFVGHCWWGGWGGPRVVNNVVIQKNVYVNVRNVNVYRNQTVNHAVMAVHRDRFGQGRVEHVRLSRQDATRLRPVRGPLAVKPTPASLVAREGRARRPPASAQARQVVATRPPQDPSRRLRAAGVNAPAHAGPPPRLVQAPRSVRAGGREAGGPQRATPPPHPGMANRRGGQAPSGPASPGRARGGRPEAGPSASPGGQRQRDAGSQPPRPQRQPGAASRPPRAQGGEGGEAPRQAAPARPAPPYPSTQRAYPRTPARGNAVPREGGGEAPRRAPREGGGGGGRPGSGGPPSAYRGSPQRGHERGHQHPA